MNKDLLILAFSFVFTEQMSDFKLTLGLQVQYKGEQSLNLTFYLALSTGPCMAVPMLYVLSGCTGTIML